MRRLCSRRRRHVEDSELDRPAVNEMGRLEAAENVLNRNLTPDLASRLHSSVSDGCDKRRFTKFNQSYSDEAGAEHSKKGDITMPCAEITKAIAWSKKTTGGEVFPVKAYFTKHFGGGATSVTAAKDAVHYASGFVTAADKPTPHLFGTLKAAKNTEEDGEMAETSELTYDVEIYPDGPLSYLMKLKGKPIGGLPATKVPTDLCQRRASDSDNGV